MDWRSLTERYNGRRSAASHCKWHITLQSVVAHFKSKPFRIPTAASLQHRCGGVAACLRRSRGCAVACPCLQIDTAPKNSLLSSDNFLIGFPPFFMKSDIHPKYVDAEIRCACGNVIKTRSTKPVIIVGICNVCHPFYTGQQKFVDTAGRVDKFQQRLAKTQAAQAEHATRKKKKV
jgi:large subunit ribosomal protein L31